MATIENRNGKYRVKVRIKGVSQSRTFLRHADAKAWASRMEADIMDGLQGNVRRDLLFGDLLKRYRDEVSVQKRGAKQEILRINRTINTALARVPVADLRPFHFADWRDMRLMQVSADSVLRELSTLSAVCTTALKEWGLLAENPVFKISKPRSAKARTRRPTDDELQRISIALGFDDDCGLETVAERVGAIMWFAVYTGMRSGEICALLWDDVDFERRLALLHETKNGYGREVPLSRAALLILERLQGITEESVFEVNDHMRDILFRRARDLCGIEDLHFHDLRREALTRMAKKVPVEVLAKISGHRDLRILLNTYYRPDMAEVADLLD